MGWRAGSAEIAGTGQEVAAGTSACGQRNMRVCSPGRCPRRCTRLTERAGSIPAPRPPAKRDAGVSGAYAGLGWRCSSRWMHAHPCDRLLPYPGPPRSGKDSLEELGTPRPLSLTRVDSEQLDLLGWK